MKCAAIPLSQEAGLRFLARARILHRAFSGDKNDLFTFPFVFIAADFTLILNDLVVEAREQVSPIVIIVLRPTVERMVVALGALQSRAEEHLRGRLGACGWIAAGAIVVGRRRAVGAAAGGNQLANKLIERFVLSDAVADPVVKILHALLV